MWFLIVFYLDPGGFLYAYLPPLGITFVQLVFTVVLIVLYSYNLKKIHYEVVRLPYIKAYLVIIILWNLYYFIVYYGVNNNEEYPGIFISILRNMVMIINSLIVLPIVFLSLYSLKSFLKILVISTFIIGMGFLLTVQTGLPFVPTWVGTRSQLENAYRTFLYGYGLMNFVIPIFIVVLYSRFKYEKTILISSIVVILMMFTTVFRRDIVGAVEHILIIALLISIIERKKILKSISKFINIRSVSIGMTLFISLRLFAPNYLETAEELFTNSLIELGLIETRNSALKNDLRMSLTAKVGIINAISENFYFGTGYDVNWFKGDGGTQEWEGADYVFLGAFGMYGIVGLILFLPFYILSVKVIIGFVKTARDNFNEIENNKNLLYPLVVGVAASSEIIKNILEYPNWYYPVGAIQDRGKYFIFLGLLIGSYYNFKIRLKKENLTIHG